MVTFGTSVAGIVAAACSGAAPRHTSRILGTGSSHTDCQIPVVRT